MHLLVLSAFRQDIQRTRASQIYSLNAPFGAQCFPTRYCQRGDGVTVTGLNAPFGAQCFPTDADVE